MVGLDCWDCLVGGGGGVAEIKGVVIGLEDER